MNPTFQQYLNSWKKLPTIGLIWIHDVLTVLILTFLWLGFGNLLTSQALAMSGGKTAEELKVLLFTQSLEANQAFLGNIKVFFFLLTGGTILVIILTILIFSLFQARIWSTLLAQPLTLKKYWRWNWITLIIGIILVIYLMVYAFIRFFTNLIPYPNEITYLIVTQLVVLVFLLTFFFISFIVFKEFAQTNKVWETFHNVYLTLVKHKKTLLKKYGFTILTTVVIGIISSLLQRFFITQPIITMFISIGFLLIITSWMRVYIAMET
ncbi:TPA: hypothetical protein HA241_03130 [Candidatus Woesearchaeota archaeon]|nr:hypothetical protein [Candidatus Woesearchaeota archaeon]